MPIHNQHQKPHLSFSCSEDWNKMIPCGQGRHCSSCQKTVIDFTPLTDAEVQALLAKQQGKVCGRFYNYQLAQPEIHVNGHSFRNLMSSLLILFGLGFLLKGEGVVSKIMGKGVTLCADPGPDHVLTGVVITGIDNIRFQASNNNNYPVVVPDSVIDSPDDYLDKKNHSLEKASENEAPYEYVEVMPVFKFGGQGELLKYIQDKISYSGIDSATQGIVFTKFTVTSEGNVINPVVLKSLSPAADKEAVRVVQLLEFEPGIQNGKLVNVNFSVPVRFGN